MRRRKTEPERGPRITHDQVVELLVDYHLGRLNAEVNRAIELHVTRCPLCQIQGLVHTGTEKRAILRRMRRARPARRRVISRRGWLILVILVIIIVAQVAAYLLLRGNLIALPGR